MTIFLCLSSVLGDVSLPQGWWFIAGGRPGVLLFQGVLSERARSSKACPDVFVKKTLLGATIL